MKLSTTIICLLILLTPPRVHQPIQDVHAEPVALTVLGIVVGLAGIVNDIYGMTQDRDTAASIHRDVKQVVSVQLQQGLKPLRSINPQLKKMLQGQKQLLQGQKQISRQIKRISTQINHLTQTFVKQQEKTHLLLQNIAKENLGAHHKTQDLVVGLQESRYSASLKLIRLASDNYEVSPKQAKLWFNQALTQLLETEHYFKTRQANGQYISKEMLAILHLSMATCYIGLLLKAEAIRSIATLISIPSPHEALSQLNQSLNHLLDNSADNISEKNKNELNHIQKNSKVWEYTIKEEGRRLRAIKYKALSVIAKDQELKALWARHEATAVGRSELAESDLAIQAFATLSAQYAYDAKGKRYKPKWKKSALKIPAATGVNLFEQMDKEAIDQANDIKNDVQNLVAMVKVMSTSRKASKSQTQKVRKVLRKISALTASDGELHRTLQQCVNRKEKYMTQCRDKMMMFNDLLQTFPRIDHALSVLEK